MSRLRSGQVGGLDVRSSVLSTDTFLVNTRLSGDSVNTFMGKVSAAQIVTAGLTADPVFNSVTTTSLTVTGTTTLNTALTGGLEATAGVVSAFMLTTAGKDLIDDATVADQRTTLGLGSIALLNSIATTNIDNLAVTEPKLAVAVQAKLNQSTFNNFSAVTDPTVTNDDTEGYVVGSTWINTVSDDAFRCMDNSTGAAVWVLTTLTTSDLGTMAVQDAVSVNITGGSIDDVPIGATTQNTGDFTTLSATGTTTLVDVLGHRLILTNAATSITLALSDSDRYIRLTSGSAVTITVPANATVAFPAGTEIDFVRAGAGTVTFAAAGGVTVNSAGGLLSITDQFGGATIKKIGTNEWDLIGGLS